MKIRTKRLTYVPMSKVVAMFDAGITDQIEEQISDSNVSYGWDKQSTYIHRDTFLELISDMFEGSDGTESEIETLNAALKEGIAKVMKNVGPMTFLLVEA